MIWYLYTPVDFHLKTARHRDEITISRKNELPEDLAGANELIHLAV
jgi:hypothetical protein